MILGSHHGVNEILIFVGCYAVLMGSHQRLVQPISSIFMGLIGCLEILVIKYQSMLRNIPEERRS